MTQGDSTRSGSAKQGGLLTEVGRHLRPPAGVRLWHGGPTVVGALRGVSHQTAAWRPAPERHSIWELALHIAYWDYAVRRRIEGGPRGGFPRAPSDWPSVPVQASAEAWNDDRRLVRDCQDLLAEAVLRLDPARLGEAAGRKSRTTYADLVMGILLHDTYHTGQIQLMRRLAPEAGSDGN